MEGLPWQAVSAHHCRCASLPHPPGRLLKGLEGPKRIERLQGPGRGAQVGDSGPPGLGFLIHEMPGKVGPPARPELEHFLNPQPEAGGRALQAPLCPHLLGSRACLPVMRCSSHGEGASSSDSLVPQAQDGFCSLWGGEVDARSPPLAPPHSPHDPATLRRDQVAARGQRGSGGAPPGGTKPKGAKQWELRARRASWRKGSPVSLPFASSPLSRVLGPWAGRPARGLSAASLPCASVCLSPSLWVWHVSFPCSSPPSPSPSPIS